MDMLHAANQPGANSQIVAPIYTMWIFDRITHYMDVLLSTLKVIFYLAGLVRMEFSL